MRVRFCGGLAVAVAMLATGACTAPAGDDPVVGIPPNETPDFTIAAQLYAGTPRTPPGFLADPAPESFMQVTTLHLKTRDIDTNAPAQHELCTDLWAQALAWSETAAQQAPVYLDLVGNLETERYFEFDRVPHGDSQRYVRMRVFRCEYLNREGVDLDATVDFAGTLNVRPLDAPALGGLAEYLWEFSEYDNVDHAVVFSAPRQVPTGLAHTLTLASLERGVSCDRVVMREWTTTADPATGDLHSTIAQVGEFSVHRTGATVVLGC